jgi:hypothetical protein
MKDLDLDKPSENLDYKLVPAIGENGSDLWNVELLRAPWENTTIRYNNVRINGEEGNISYNFDVISTEKVEYTIDNITLQGFASEVLGDILDVAITEGYLQKTEDSNDGNQSTTDDSAESTD